MRLRPPEVPPQEDWQQVLADIDKLIQQLVDESTSPMPQRDFQLRRAKLKLEPLRQRLWDLKQRLHQHVQRMEDQLRQDPKDLDARYLAAVGEESLADLWLMESLLDRLTGPTDQKADRRAGFSYELPSTRSGGVSESA